MFDTKTNFLSFVDPKLWPFKVWRYPKIAKFWKVHNTPPRGPRAKKFWFSKFPPRGYLYAKNDQNRGGKGVKSLWSALDRALGEKKKQSQKRYMVSGSLCPLISFFDVSYLVSFVVRGQRPRRGRWPMVPPHRRAGGGLEPAGRALEPAGRASEPAGRTPDPAGRSLEPAGRALEPAGRPRASWEGQPRSRGGGGDGGKTQRERKNRALPVCGGTIGHRPLRGRCPKTRKICP